MASPRGLAGAEADGGAIWNTGHRYRYDGVVESTVSTKVNEF